MPHEHHIAQAQFNNHWLRLLSGRITSFRAGRLTRRDEQQDASSQVTNMSNSEKRNIMMIGRRLFNWVVGLLILLALWWVGGYLLYINPDTTNFADFGPGPTFKALPHLWSDGTIPDAITSSGYRLGIALGIAIVIGIPIGIMLGRLKKFRELSNSPFQLLRMVSPLSWEPIAVIVFLSWDQAIIFLLAIAAVWPVAFSTAAGLAKVDPSWFKVAKKPRRQPLAYVNADYPAGHFIRYPDRYTCSDWCRLDRTGASCFSWRNLRSRLFHCRCQGNPVLRSSRGHGAGDRLYWLLSG